MLREPSGTSREGQSTAGWIAPLQREPVVRSGLLSAVLDRLRDLRNHQVADPSFRRWASRFPLTRPFARRQAKALFDLTAGFVYSQVLSAAVRVRLFELLAPGPLDPDTLALRMALPPEGALRLLRGATALRLVEPRSDGRYALGSLGAALVGSPGVTAMIAHHDMLYRDLADPVALLAGESDAELGRYWSYAGDRKPGCGSLRPTRDPADYTALMAASQDLIAAEILDAYPIGRHRRLLDVGGGDGSFLVAAAKAAPDLQLGLFDLPPVVSIARAKILAAGLSGRTTISSGDFLSDALPEAADLITLNRVLHDHDDAAALAILRQVRHAIAPGGTLLVAEPMAETPGAEASGDAYFGFYLLAMGQGRPRTSNEIMAMLRAVGFSRCRLLTTSTPLIARMAIGRALA